MIVRTFEKPDGSIVVLVPARGRSLDVCEAHCRAIESPLPDAATALDVDHTDLPGRRRNDADGDPHSIRNGWRRQGNRVVVSEPHVPPNWEHLVTRLGAEFDAGIVARYAGQFREAIRMQSAPAVQAVARAMQVDLQPQQRGRLRQILQRKSFGDIGP